MNKKEVKNTIERKDDKFVFVAEIPVDDEKIIRREFVSKRIFKKHYDEIKQQQIKRRNDLAAVNKRLEGLNIEKDIDMERFLELANRAAKYNEMIKAQEERDSVLLLLNNIDKQVADMEKVLPELKRVKKP